MAKPHRFHPKRFYLIGRGGTKIEEEGEVVKVGSREMSDSFFRV